MSQFLKRAVPVLLIWIYFSVQIFFVGAEVVGYIQRRRDETRDGERMVAE